jgi:hypothetical protein
MIYMLLRSTTTTFRWYRTTTQHCIVSQKSADLKIPVKLKLHSNIIRQKEYEQIKTNLPGNKMPSSCKISGSRSSAADNSCVLGCANVWFGVFSAILKDHSASIITLYIEIVVSGQ